MLGLLTNVVCAKKVEFLCLESVQDVCKKYLVKHTFNNWLKILANKYATIIIKTLMFNNAPLRQLPRIPEVFCLEVVGADCVSVQGARSVIVKSPLQIRST